MTDIFAYEKRCAAIGQRLKELRKERSMTQKQLAGLISDLVPTDKEKGFGQSTISGWEKGNQLPPLPKLIALSEIFACDISYLLCDYDTKNKDISDISRITGLSEQAVNTLCYLNENSFGRVSISPFGSSDISLSEVLDELITSEEFVGILKRLGQYLVNNAVTVSPNHAIDTLPVSDLIKFRIYTEQRGYKIAEKEDISEVHLQIAVDMLKTTFRNILKKRSAK